MGLDSLINASVCCTVCGSRGVGTCSCWSKCKDCGWNFRTGEQCRNCAGDNTLEAIAMSKPKRRRPSSQEK